MSEGTRDLRWLPKLAAEELQREVDALCALRLAIAGLALRHAVDASSGDLNCPLGQDIATLQQQLQAQIDRIAEAVSALRDLARVIDGQPPATSPSMETLH